MTNVTNPSNTVGFVDLDDLYADEIVTSVNVDLLEDAVKAARVLSQGNSWTKTQVHLVHAEDDDTPPAIALSTDLSRPTAVMVGSASTSDSDA